jgi:hypothetical protein
VRDVVVQTRTDHHPARNKSGQFYLDDDKNYIASSLKYTKDYPCILYTNNKINKSSSDNNIFKGFTTAIDQFHIMIDDTVYRIPLN